MSEIRFKGELYADLPKDLYIPPEALEVFLELFSGPLDLLLYLIRKHNLDILEISIAQISTQYMQYVQKMVEINLTLAADYLVMAATLASIKSRMLLPSAPEGEEDGEADPRLDLIRRLEAYQIFKEAAEQLTQRPQVGIDVFLIEPVFYTVPRIIEQPTFGIEALVLAFNQVLKNQALMETHKIKQSVFSVRVKMSGILALMSNTESVLFSDCFSIEEGRLGMVYCFIAILELMKEGLIDVVQDQSFDAIYLQRIPHATT